MLLASVALVAAVVALPGRAAAQTVTLAPVADAYVRSDKPTKSFGTTTDLRADASPVETAYLRFDVQGLQGPVTSASLRLFATADANTKGADLRGVADSTWTESKLTYDNAPAPAGTIASHVGAFAANSTIGLDATSLVGGNGTVSMAVTAASTTVRTFNSRESTTNRPQLVLSAKDAIAPVVTVAVPADGSATGDATPTFSGSAGTLPGDSGTITVKVFAGSAATGFPVQTLTATQVGGAWSATALMPLVDGPYTVQAQQADTDGNLGTSAPRTFSVDRTPPDVVLDSFASGGWSGDATPDFTGTAGTAAGDDGTVRVRIYGGQSASGTPLQTQTSPVAADGAWAATASTLADGTYTVRAEQLDGAGNLGLSRSATFAVDTTAPAPSVIDPPTGSTTTDTTPPVRGTAATGAGDSDTIAIEIYAGTSASGTPDVSFTATQAGGDWAADVPSPLESGTYTVRAVQADAAGNTGASSSHSFRVASGIAPVVTLSEPENGSVVATATPRFAGRAGTGAGDASTVAVNVFSGSSTGGTLVESLSAAVGSDGTWSVTASPALDERTYTAQASQSGSTGETGSSVPATFAIDVTPPDTFIDSAPPDPATSATATFGFHADEDGVRYECRLDGAAYAGCTSGSSITGLDDGGHTFAVRAVDAAGNVDPTPASFAWAIDTAAPAVTLTNPPDGTSTTNPSPTFSGAAGTAAGDSDTVTVQVHAGSGTSGTLVQTLTATRAGGTWSAAASAPLPDGTYTAEAEQRDSAGNVGRSATTTITVGAPVIAAAGDIACDAINTNFKGGDGTSTSCHQKATSNLVAGQGLTAVLGLGDLQYYCSGYQAYLQSYDLTWGRVKQITFPAIGNHEYDTSGGTDCDPTGNAGGYFRYWGDRAGDPAKAYYSFDIGSWHLIALNSNVSCLQVGCGLGSPQEQWLKADLAAHPNRCTLAYWHAPRFSSGSQATSTSQFWKDLYAAGADVVLGGHVHNYERFAPMDPNGTPDPAKGIREFVVGTGGASHGSFSTILATSEVHDNSAYGVLRLTLHAGGYDWEFVPEAGKTFTDAGSGTCH